MYAFRVYGGKGVGGWNKDVRIGVYGSGIRMYTLGWNNDVRIGIRMYAFRVYGVWGWNKDVRIGAGIRISRKTLFQYIHYEIVTC